MCTAVLTVASAIGSVMQGSAQRSAANAQAQAAEVNARIAETQATDAVLRGGQDELRMRRRLGGLVGSQNVAAAASGLSLDSGSLSDVRLSSLEEGERDIRTNEGNAQRERWGYEVEAINHMNAASAARASGKNAFTSGLIGASTKLLSLASPTVDTIGSGITVEKREAPFQGDVMLGPSRDMHDVLNIASHTPSRTVDALDIAGYVPGGRIPYWRSK